MLKYTAARQTWQVERQMSRQLYTLRAVRRHNELTKRAFENISALPNEGGILFFFSSPPQHFLVWWVLTSGINENHKYLIWDCTRRDSSELGLDERKKRLVCGVGSYFKFPGTEYLPFFLFFLTSTTTSTSTRPHVFFYTFLLPPPLPIFPLFMP